MEFNRLLKIIFLIILCLYTVHSQSVFSQQEDTTHVLGRSYTIPMIAISNKDTIINEDTIIVKDVHPQDSPEDRGFLITSEDGKSQFRIRGSIRLNGIYDFNGLQNHDNFDTYAIPVGDANISEPRYLLNANQTRFGIEATRETFIGNVFMRIESDFLGKPNVLRLRHAYGKTKRILVGQTWSTFSDVNSVPTTVDIDGPNSSVTERKIQIRYMDDISDDFR